MKLFSKIRNKSDIKDIFLEYYDDTSSQYYQDTIEESLTSLNRLDSKKENFLIALSQSVDTYFVEKESDKKEVANKLNTIMTSALILDKFYQETESLNDKEFISIAFFCSSQIPEFIESKINIYNKNILSLLCSRFENYDDKEHLLEIIDYKVENSKIKGEEDIISFIGTTSQEDINDLYSEYGNDLVADMHNSGVLK